MREIRSWGTRALAGVGALVLLGACGTTVPLSTQRSLENTGGAYANGGLGGTGAGLQGGPGGAGALGPSTTTGSAGGVLGAAGSAGGGGVVGGGGGGAGSVGGLSPTQQASDGPGVSATTINVGEQYDPNAGAEDAALGFGGLNPGDVQAEVNAVVAYINGHGGVAGRKLNVLWYQLTATQDVQQQEQGACTFWTSDHKVFILPGGVPIWDQCATNEHAIAPYSGDIAQEDTPIMQQYPMAVNIDGMTLDRSMRYTIEGLQRQGYFASGAKVGIATWNQPDFQWSIEHAALPALATIGIKNPPVEYITSPQTESDLSSSSADISNAILKFRQNGIDHVLLFDGTAGINSAGTLVILWMNAAGSQQWFPKYGLNSTSGLSTAAPDEPASELQNALAVGWNPSLDLSSGDFNSLPSSPNEKLCLQIMRSAGQTPSSQNAQGVALSVCDRYFLLKYALDKVRGPLNQSTAMAAINSLGTTFPIMSTFEANFTPSQHDGPYFVRNAAFNSSCTCFKYTSAAYNPG